jgi:peptide deformylase
MAIRRILTVADPADVRVLKQVSTPVGGVDDDLRALMDDMLETMYDAPGIGLAAVQVGEPKRVIVMDLGDGEPRGEGEEPARRPRYFVNPEITWRSDELFTYEEGCLSVPEIFDAVERPARCRLKYLDYDGNPVEEEAEGLYAVCIQHEFDHLEGVLFIDKLSRLKRERAISKVKKAQQAA